jgi:hypothetical protein
MHFLIISPTRAQTKYLLLSLTPTPTLSGESFLTLTFQNKSSGSANTPHASAIESPSDRVKAQPGRSKVSVRVRVRVGVRVKVRVRKVS